MNEAVRLDQGPGAAPHLQLEEPAAVRLEPRIAERRPRPRIREELEFNGRSEDRNVHRYRSVFPDFEHVNQRYLKRMRAQEKRLRWHLRRRNGDFHHRHRRQNWERQQGNEELF
ncbi:unnamed protein product [Strongylus vulgaris]|uniref:Uncharacterized protein n=1 Tax=Strongylus vulgaris TaxID=40348 RepID=A0A3P7JK13_STRVU|nr:unnamed protein product [Strongylus vulgaris]